MDEFRTGVIRPVECFKEAWELIKDQYWLLLGITFVGAVIGGASMYILLGAMLCGVYYCYFKKIDGKPVVFEELFKGFSYFLPGLIVVLVMIIPTIIVFAGIYIPFIIAAVMGSNLSQDEFMLLLGGTLVAELVFAFFMVCLHTLLMFAFPLIVDRNLSAGKAMMISAKAVWKNMSGVIGLFLVAFVLAIAGYLFFCIGIYFVIPIIIAANIVAYRKVFPAVNNANFIGQPASPVSFRDAV